MKPTHLIRTSLLLAAGLLLSSAASQTALSIHVVIDTSALVGNSAGPFSLNFQLNSGNDLGNNTATLSNFTFGGGSAAGIAEYLGGASGNLNTTVTLTDSGFLNDFLQEFAAGSRLEFDLFLTQNVDSGPTPDGFSVAILDNLDQNITTNGNSNTLLQLDINSPTAGNQYSDLNFASGTGSFAGVAAVPEPSAALLGVLASGLVLLRRRRAA